MGSGFAPSGNYVLGNGNQFAGPLSSPDGKTLTFTVPSSAGAYCPPSAGMVACPMYLMLINPGSYQLSVVNASGTSNAMPFAVTSQPSSIVITSPAGGEQWPVGSTHAITWIAPSSTASVNIGAISTAPCTGSFCNVSLFMHLPIVVASNAPNTGSYAWSIDSGFSAGSYQLTISDATSSGLSATSNFTLVAPSPSSTIGTSTVCLPIDCAAPPAGCNYIGGNTCQNGVRASCGTLSCGSPFGGM